MLTAEALQAAVCFCHSRSNLRDACQPLQTTKNFAHSWVSCLTYITVTFKLTWLYLQTTIYLGHFRPFLPTLVNKTFRSASSVLCTRFKHQYVFVTLRYIWQALQTALCVCHLQIYLTSPSNSIMCLSTSDISDKPFKQHYVFVTFRYIWRPLKSTIWFIV